MRRRQAYRGSVRLAPVAFVRFPVSISVVGGRRGGGGVTDDKLVVMARRAHVTSNMTAEVCRAGTHEARTQSAPPEREHERRV